MLMDNNEYSTDVVFELNNEKRRKIRMRNIIGWIIIIFSILLGLYVGVWTLFAGGIIDIVNAINPLNSLGIALGIIKIIIASPVGWMIVFLGTVVGAGIRD